MPTLEKLYRQDADSQPFRIPVDPVSLGIPVSLYYSCVLVMRIFIPSVFLIFTIKL